MKGSKKKKKNQCEKDQTENSDHWISELATKPPFHIHSPLSTLHLNQATKQLRSYRQGD